MEICEVCHKQINGFSPIFRRFHKECDIDRRRIAREKLAEDKKRLLKLTFPVRNVLVFIGRYLNNPTETQIKDVCSYYGADYSSVIDNFDLKEIANDSDIKVRVKAEKNLNFYDRKFGKHRESML